MGVQTPASSSYSSCLQDIVYNRMKFLTFFLALMAAAAAVPAVKDRQDYSGFGSYSGDYSDGLSGSGYGKDRQDYSGVGDYESGDYFGSGEFFGSGEYVYGDYHGSGDYYDSGIVA